MKKTEILILGGAAVFAYLMLSRTANAGTTGQRIAGLFNLAPPAAPVPRPNQWSVAPIVAGDKTYVWTGNSYGGTSDTGGAFGLGGF